MDIFAYISGPKHAYYFKLVYDEYYGFVWAWHPGLNYEQVFLIEDDKVNWNTIRVKFREEHLSCPIEIRSI